MADRALAPDDARGWAQLVKRELRSIQPDQLPADWPDDALFRDDLRLDSLDLVELVARIEQTSGVFVPDADLPQWASVQAVVQYLLPRLAQPSDAAAT